VEEQEMDYKKTILIVDDEKMILNLLSCNLIKEGYNVIEAKDGLEAITIAQEEKPDLILLDVMLPKLDGLSVCKRVKNIMNVPILMVTAKDDELDKILGLELGADDYITKPFSIRELLARVKANLRKADVIANVKKEVKEVKKPEETPELKRTNIIKVGVLTLDLDRFEVMVNDRIVDLTLREFEVLKFLASDPGQVITRETLLEKVWGYEYYGDIRTVDVTVRRIREKIERDTSNPKILITKRGVGYYIAT
jgi:response regulator protein